MNYICITIDNNNFMLGMHKKSIITQLTEEQSVLLPTELWENIEDATSSYICILYENLLNNEVIVKIIDYYSGTMLDEILIKDFNNDIKFNKIKLSSDSKYLVYIDTSNNIIFYDIYLKTITFSKNLDFVEIPEGQHVSYSYFDNNGCRYSVSYNNITFVYNIQTSEKILTLNFKTSDHKFNKNYSRFSVISLSEPSLNIYDMDTKENIFTIRNVIMFCNISDSGKYAISDETPNINDRYDIWNIDTAKWIMEYDNDNGSGLAVSSSAFSKDEIYTATHYYCGKIIVCNIKEAHIVKEFTDSDYIFRGKVKIDFSHDNKFIIIRNNDKLIRIYDWINEKCIAEYKLSDIK